MDGGNGGGWLKLAGCDFWLGVERHLAKAAKVLEMAFSRCFWDFLGGVVSSANRWVPKKAR